MDARLFQLVPNRGSSGHAPTRQPLHLVLVVTGASFRGHSRHDQLNGRTCAGLAFEPKLPSQSIHDDAVDDMQTKTTRAIMPARGEKRIEGAPLHVGCHATAVVGEHNFYMLTPRRANRDLDVPLSPAGEGMRDRIDGEIGQGLTEWPGVAVHDKIRFASEAERNVALLQLPRKLGENLPRQFACVEALPMRFSLIGRYLLEGLKAFGGPAEI
jgi:hypothetical protein